jgi:hypothetical protein
MKNFLLNTSAVAMMLVGQSFAIDFSDDTDLESRISNVMKSHFTKTTGIVAALKETTSIEPLGVVTLMELKIYDYIECMKGPMQQRTAIKMQMSKPALLEAILQNHPGDLKDLKSQLNMGQ